MAKKARTTGLDQEIAKEKAAKLKEVDERFTWHCCCGLGISIHRVVLLIALLCLVFDGMSLANMLIKHTYHNELGPLAARALVNLLLLVGNVRYTAWMYYPFLCSKAFQVLVTLAYGVYLAGVRAGLFASYARFDEFVGLVRPADADRDTLAGIFMGLALVLAALAAMLAAVGVGVRYLGARRRVVVEFAARNHRVIEA